MEATASKALAGSPALSLCPNSKGPIECAQCRVRALSLCDALEPDELHELDRLSQTLSFAARQTLFEQDQPSDSVYNVTAGAVRLYKLLPDGRRQVVGFALPGDFLGLAGRDWRLRGHAALYRAAGKVKTWLKLKRPSRLLLSRPSL